LAATADDNGHRFGHHCCQNSIKHIGQWKLINFYFNLWNLFNRFDGGIGTNMRKAAHPSGGMGSSNSRLWRGWWLHHNGDGVW
jgi:hypothetical protein